jgi:peptidoglycan/LPS O-acetylase OafA/YrhL
MGIYREMYNGDIRRTENNFGFLRIFFAILVILSHSPELVDGNRSREILTNIFETISFGEFAVDGFFLVSGYLITNSWERSRSASSYLVKRVLRIYPGFIVAFLISLLIVGSISGGDVASLAGRPGLEQFIRMLFLRGPQMQGAFGGLPHPQLNSPMWTIAYEFRCYLLTMAFGALGVIQCRLAYLGLTVTLLIGMLIAPHVDFAIPQSALLILGSPGDDLRFLSIFCCGGVFYLYRDRIYYNNNIAIIAILVGGFLLFIPRLAQPGLAVFGGYTLFWFSFHARAKFLNQLDNKIDLSYGIYLYAWPVQNLIIWQFRGISPWFLFALSTIITALAAMASWFMVERPFLNIKKRILVRGLQMEPAA